jgi:flagellar assembly protein FliH
MANNGNRIPADKSQAFSAWLAPEVKDGQIIQAEKLKERGPRGEIINVDKNAVVYNKMTAGQLEKITTQAYDEIHQQAYKKGFEQGQKDGQKKGVDASKKLLTQQTEALKQVSATLLHLVAGQENAIEQALMNTAISIAGSILRRELQLDSSHIKAIVAEAVAKLPLDAENITVFLSEDDCALLRDNSEIPPQWQLRVDRALSSGGCRISTRQSVVEFSLQQQFDQTIDDLVEQRFAALAVDNQRLAQALADSNN